MAAELVNGATSEKLAETDWTKNIEICELVAHDRRQARDVVKAIKKRLGSKHPDTQLYAVLLLEMLMNNIGEHIHELVIDTGIIPILVKIVKKKSDLAVRERIFLLLDATQTSLGGASGKFPQYYNAYYELVSAGVQFSQRDQVVQSDHPSSQPNRTSNVPNREQAAPRHEAVSQQAESQTVPESSIIQKASNALEVLKEVLDAVDAQNPQGARDEFTLDLVEQCSFQKQRVMHLVMASRDERIVSRAIELNEQLQKVLARHDDLLAGRVTTTATRFDHEEGEEEEEPEQLVRRLRKGKACARPEDEETETETRTMSAILLRRHLTRHHDSFLWPLLSPAARSSLHSLLLSSLQQEPVKSIAKKLCDTVSELAAAILPEDPAAWPNLLPLLFQWVTSPEPRLQEVALLIFAQLAHYIGQTLLPQLSTLHSVFLRCLHSSTPSDVRIASLAASINFIQCLTSSADRDRFQDLLPLMMQTLTEALNSGQEAVAQEALELLIELAGTEPRFLRRQIVDVVGAMLQVAEAEALEEGTRHLAIEFVVTLAEARERAPGMMRKLPQFVRKLFGVLLNLLLDIEDAPAWHAAVDEEEDAGETSNYGFGQECLDRLSISLGGNTIVPVASELLPTYLSAPEWEKHHAALIALAQIAEGCSKVMIKNLEQVLSMILNSFCHPHPRVRWAAINAIGQLSTDLGPDLQVKFHHLVLPALAGAMDDFQNPRVQAHAASAVLNFTENCTPDILTPYLEGIVSKLLVLLQNGKQMVQEGALTALASVADSSQEQFQKYYDAVMPYLKAILVNANDKSNRMLRAKAMECISLVGMAVGKEKFRDDAKQVMDVLMSLQQSQLDPDDPTASYMLQAWARLCKCLGQDFLPYMGFVMPPLIQSAQLKPDVTITSADSDTEFDEDDDSIETITLGDKRIGIKTSVLEEKATACNMLCCYADELKEGFFPWIDQVAFTLVPLLKFYFHEEVRKAAVSAMPELLTSAKSAVEKGQSQGRDETYIKQLSDYIIPNLVEALHKEPEVEICSSMLDALNECIQVSGPHLDEKQVRSIVDEIKQVLTASSTRKHERAERAKEEDFDAEERELLKEENEQEEDLFDQVGDCLGTLIKTFRTSFLPFFDELSSYITPMFGKDKTSEERRIAICIFDDVAEHCRETALKYYDSFLPFLLEACNDEYPDVRQAAVYGVGVCAEFGGSVFKPLVGEALSRLDAVIRHPNAQLSDNVMAYDNAVSALGKICQFHRDSINATQVVPAWLSCLPIKGDLIEAKVVHDQLCSMVERSDRELIGPNNQYLPKIVAVFAEILCAGNDLATEQTVSRMINLLRQLQQTLPPSTLASTWSSLQPQQQLALQSILSS